MTTRPAAPTAAARHPFARAFSERDFDALEATLAPDVVLRSPIISTPFEGAEEVARLLAVVRTTFEDWWLLDEIDCGDTLALSFRARVGRQPLQGADLIRFDREGRVREITVFVRPLAGVTALAAALGGPLTRHRGRWRAALIGVLSGSVAFATRVGDRIGARLVLGRYEPRF